MVLMLAIGGAHIDRRGQVLAPFVPGASNPGRMREEVGGGAFNALRLAARLGVAGALMSVRGGDAAGEAVAAAIARDRITDLSAVFLDRATPSYTALLDQNGDVVAALADMELYETAFPKQARRAALRSAIGQATAVLVDANLPVAALERLVRLAEHRPLFAIAISPVKAVRLTSILPQLACLFMNTREAVALAGADPGADPARLVERLRQLGLQRAVITSGAGPLIAFDRHSTVTLPPPAPERVVDVTGAGDALAGATVAALIAGAPFEAALRDGVAAALLTVQCAESVPALTPSRLAEARAEVPLPTTLAATTR